MTDLIQTGLPSPIEVYTGRGTERAFAQILFNGYRKRRRTSVFHTADTVDEALRLAMAEAKAIVGS